MSLVSSATTVVESVGTAAAAGIIAVSGTSGVIYVDMATFLLSAVVIVTLKVREDNLQTTAFDFAAYKSIFTAGVGYVCKNSRLVFLVGACVFLNAILVPFNSLQAPLVQEILGGGAEVLSILSSAALAGMLLGSITYPVVRSHMTGRALVAAGGMGIGIYYILLVAGRPLYDSMWRVYLIAAIITSFSVAATPVTSFLVSALAVWVSTEYIFLAAGLLDLVGCGCMIFSKLLAEEEIAPA